MIKKLLTGFLTGSVVFSLSALDIVTDGIARIELESGTALPEKTAVNEFKRIIKAVTGSEIGNGKAPNKLVIGRGCLRSEAYAEGDCGDCKGSRIPRT